MPVKAAADLDALLSQMQRHVDALHRAPSAHRARYAAVERESAASERMAAEERAAEVGGAAEERRHRKGYRFLDEPYARSRITPERFTSQDRHQNKRTKLL